jgi:hypothetical protein
MFEIVLFLTASKWVTECDIYDDPRVKTRFQWYNSVVLCYTIVTCAIGEQWSYAVEILF